MNWLKSRMESAYWSPSNDSVVSNEDSTSRTFHRTTSAQVSAAVLPTRGKPFRPVLLLRKKSGPLLKLTFWKHLGRWKFCYVCLCACEKYNISLICTELEKIRGEKLIFKKFGPFRPCLYRTKSAKIRPQLCPAALLFIRPFLSYAAQQSASWQHWSEAAGLTSGTGIRCSGITIRTLETLEAKRHWHSFSLIFGFIRR